MDRPATAKADPWRLLHDHLRLEAPTFGTLPKELRSLAWGHQKIIYNLITQNGWETIKTFSQNDRKLQGVAGAITVLHTHNRRLDYHPHLHLVMPAAAIDTTQRLLRKKDGKYLFNHTALAKVFRAKMLAGIQQAGLKLPDKYPEKWVVDCTRVGGGETALVYLGRYLYRGVIQEKNILSCENGNVTYRYQNSKTKRMEKRTVSGVEFLRLILQHILPKGYRRARNFGFLHPNSQWIQLIKLLITRLSVYVALKPRPPLRCHCCGGVMKIIRTRIKAAFDL